MGGGASKKQKAAAKPPPPPANPQSQAHGFDDDGWEVAPSGVPYALLCPHEAESPRASRFPSVPFDTPTGGAGVGSLRQRHLDEPLGGERSELPPTSLSVEVLEVGGLNDSATPVLCPPWPTYTLIYVYR